LSIATFRITFVKYIANVVSISKWIPKIFSNFTF